MVQSKPNYRTTKSVNKRRELRILWSSNSSWSYSGYGVFTKMILNRLRDDGWPIAQIAWYGLDSHTLVVDGVKTYPKMAEAYGSDALIAHGLDFKAHVIFTMQDIPTLNPSHLSQLRRWIPYFPVDKDPTPAPVLDKLGYAYKLLTFSKFGQETLANSGYSSTMIPEGTDLNVFKPLKNKEELRKKHEIPPNAFNFVMLAANKENPPRKGFQEALEGFKKFNDKHPESILSIYIQQLMPEGFPIIQYAHYLGLDGKVKLKFDYHTLYKWTSKDTNEIYNTADILLHPSQTEGFGLTVVEAQAAGIPAIIQRCQSMPELIVEGKTAEVAETLFKRFTNDLSFVNTADPNSVYAAMERQYKKIKENPTAVATACRNNVDKNYNIDTIFKEKWVPYLEHLQDEILPLTPNTKDTTIK